MARGGERRRGPWLIGRALAAGGQGTVSTACRADDPPDRYVIKEMAVPIDRPNRPASVALARFAAEIAVLESLQQSGVSGIVRIVDHAVHPEDGGPPWFVMPRYRHTLHDLRARFAGNIDLALDAVSHIATTLSIIHSTGVAHRDVKTRNVFFESFPGLPVLGDFGLHQNEATGESITAAGDTLGPQAWRPPEFRAGGFRGDPRKSDIYLLGGLLYELLMDRRFEESEYRGRFTHETGEYKLATRIDDPRVPYVATLLRDMLARDPELRAEARDVATRCSAIATFRPGGAVPPESSSVERARRVAAELLERSPEVRAERISTTLRDLILAAIVPLGEQGWAGHFQFSAFIQVVFGEEASRHISDISAADRADRVWVAARATVDYETPSWRIGPLLSYVVLGRRGTEDDLIVKASSDGPATVVARFPAGDPRTEALMREESVRERDRLLEQAIDLVQRRG